MSRQKYLECKNLSLSYGKKQVIKNLNLQIAAHKITVLLGANGCGKSTLLKGMANLLQPATGSVSIQGRAVRQFAPRQLAKQLAILTQNPQLNAALTVRELVALGRHPYRGWFFSSASDQTAIEKALKLTAITELAEQKVANLSGGQRQRVWIALALAQQTPWLLLDEPTTYLDLHHQLSILDLLQSLNRSQQTSMVMVLHDINMAARYGDELVLLKQGRVFATGSAWQVINSHNLQQVFNLKCKVIADPLTQTPLCILKPKTTIQIPHQGYLNEN